MITDEKLDQRLAALRENGAPSGVKFASAEAFKARFFARAAAIDAATPRHAEDEEYDEEPPSMMRRLKDVLFPERSRGVSIGMAASATQTFLSRASLFASRSAGMMKYCMMDSCMRMSAFDSDGDLGAAAPQFDTEEYRSVAEKPFLATARNPLATFGAEVDTAGYTTARRMILEENRLPAPDSVRLDEFLNYFRYDYPAPEGENALAPHFEFASAPWAPAHRLLLVGIQARTVEAELLPAAHYVFLVDNSGSMCDAMAIVKEAMGLLARQLRPQDKVSLVTYGGQVRTLCAGSGDRELLLKRIHQLKADGCTPGGQAIQQAYKLAHEHYIPGGNNRIVLITDGDFNVGASSEAALTSMVEKERGKGIYLSVIGAGCGNYKDNRMKMLANKGDGNYIYIDTPAEARRAFTQGLSGQMFTLAHDAKFQLEFNPGRVYAYRLLGYELRQMADADFRDDRKDSGEIGVGQQVTALFELVMTDAPQEVKAAALTDTPPLRYSTMTATGSSELLTFHLRYQRPEGGGAVEQEVVVPEATPGKNLEWAATIAEFALLLRNSPYKGTATYREVVARAKQDLGPSSDDERLAFVAMARRAGELAREE